MQVELDNLQQSHKNMNFEKDQIKKQTKSEIEELQQQINVLSVELSGKKQELQQCKQQLTDYTYNLQTNTNNIINSLQLQIKDHDNVIHNYKKEIQKYVEKTNQFEEAQEALKKKVSQLTIKLEKSTNENKNRNNEIDNLQKLLLEYKRKVEQFDQQNNDIKNENTLLEKTNNKLTQQTYAQQTTIQQQQNEQKEYQKTIENITNQLLAEKLTIEKLQVDIMNKDQSFQLHFKELITKKYSNEQLLNRISELEYDIKKSMENNEEMQNNNSILKDELINKTTKLEALNNKFNLISESFQQILNNKKLYELSIEDSCNKLVEHFKVLQEDNTAQKIVIKSLETTIVNQNEILQFKQQTIEEIQLHYELAIQSWDKEKLRIEHEGIEYTNVQLLALKRSLEDEKLEIYKKYLQEQIAHSQTIQLLEHTKLQLKNSSVNSITKDNKTTETSIHIQKAYQLLQNKNDQLMKELNKLQEDLKQINIKHQDQANRFELDIQHHKDQHRDTQNHQKQILIQLEQERMLNQRYQFEISSLQTRLLENQERLWKNASDGNVLSTQSQTINLEKLRSELVDTQNQLLYTEKVYESSQHKIQDLQQQIQGLKESIEQEKQLTNKTNSVIEELQHSISHYKKVIDELNEEKKILLQDMFQERQKLIDTQYNVEELLMDLNHQRSKVKQLQDTINNNDELNKLKEQLNFLNEEKSLILQNYVQEKLDQEKESTMIKNKEIITNTLSIDSNNEDTKREEINKTKEVNEITTQKAIISLLQKEKQDTIIQLNGIINNLAQTTREKEFDIQLLKESNKDLQKYNEKLLRSINEHNSQIQKLTLNLIQLQNENKTQHNTKSNKNAICQTITGYIYKFIIFYLLILIVVFNKGTQTSKVCRDAVIQTPYNYPTIKDVNTQTFEIIEMPKTDTNSSNISQLEAKIRILKKWKETMKETCKKEAARNHQEIATLRNQLSESVTEKQTAIATITKEHKKSISEYDSLLLNSNQELNTVKEKLRMLENELNDSKLKLQINLDEKIILLNNIKQNNTEIEELRSQLSNYVKESQTSMQSLNLARKDINQLQENNSSLLIHLQNKEMTIKELEEQQSKLTQLNNSYIQQVNELQQKNLKMYDQLHSSELSWNIDKIKSARNVESQKSTFETQHQQYLLNLQNKDNQICLLQKTLQNIRLEKTIIEKRLQDVFYSPHEESNDIEGIINQLTTKNNKLIIEGEATDLNYTYLFPTCTNTINSIPNDINRAIEHKFQLLDTIKDLIKQIELANKKKMKKEGKSTQTVFKEEINEVKVTPTIAESQEMDLELINQFSEEFKGLKEVKQKLFLELSVIKT